MLHTNGRFAYDVQECLAALRACVAQIPRERRVAILTLLIALMGLLDLGCTLAYMRGAGLSEMNPIARHLVRVGGVSELITFKLFTIALSAGALYLLRGRRQAEIASWACFVVMAALSAHWARYNAGIDAILPDLHTTVLHDASWVRLND